MEAILIRAARNRALSLHHCKLPSIATAALCLSNSLFHTATAITMPSPPYAYRSSDSKPLDLSALEAQITTLEDQRQRAFELSRDMQVAILQAKTALEYNEDTSPVTTKLDTLLENPLLKQLDASDRAPRHANLSFKMEDYLRFLAFQRFLQSADLLPPAAPFTDEEYLGACMGLAQDLQRYGLGRATVRDVASVQAAADLVGDLLDFLLQLDFRNGPLRRKYDGTKYSLKALETLLYELAVTDSSRAVEGTSPAKRSKVEKASTMLLPLDSLQALQSRMVYRDDLRESLIKKCRDGQKAAKQSIFALHRGDKEKALELLTECHNGIVNELLPIVVEEPLLRNGSFANVLEEYVEGKLFCAWLYGKDYGRDVESDQPSGTVLKPEDFDIALEPAEYLGGLCDLTGEVGRYAVQRGTARDVRGVQLCLETNTSIYTALQAIGRLPQGIPKKMDQLRYSVEKIERMLYEMSLSEAAGGRNVRSEVDESSAMNEEN